MVMQRKAQQEADYESDSSDSEKGHENPYKSYKLYDSDSYPGTPSSYEDDEEGVVWRKPKFNDPRWLEAGFRDYLTGRIMPDPNLQYRSRLPRIIYKWK